MAATSLPIPVRRRHSRYELTCPVEVTVLRSGIPQNLPGRVVDAGLGGMSIVVSSDLYPGETVGVEFRFVDAPAAVQARARVRYQDRLRCGLEFTTVGPDKLELVRLWTDQRYRVVVSEADTIKFAPIAEPQFLQAAAPKPPRAKWQESRHGSSGVAKAVTGIVIVGVLAVSAWAYRHYSARSRTQAQSQASGQPELLRRVIVAADVMQSLITYRAMPAYPMQAQQQGIEGTVLLDTVVGKDGRVLEVHVISGPPELANSATDAVKNWRFSPFTLNGDAVEVETTIEVEFRLKDR
jgi:TonB family protein